MSGPHRTDYVIGYFDPVALAANYQCGHCNSEAVLGTDAETGAPRVEIRHDDGCPVRTGALSSLPDALRAALPDTFRP